MRSVALVALLAGMCLAQAPTATIVGRVSGPAQIPLRGASVIIHAADRGESLTAVTDSDGRFSIASLPANVYRVLVRKAGFQPGTDSIELSPEQEGEIEISLEPDDAVQSPDALRQAVQRQELRRDTSAGTDAVGRSELLSLPLSDDPLRIIAQTAGMSLNPTEEGSVSVNVGGARSESSNVFYDGFISLNPRNGAELIRPSLEALEAVKTKADALSAQYAKRAGLVATVVTKRGGDRYHGSLFGYFRNDNLNSRNFFDGDKPQNNRAQFGGVVGGPVRIPGLYDGHHRTFFFVALEYFRESLGTTRISGVPTALEHAGDYSQSTGAGGEPVVLSDPFNPGETFPGNRIPASLFSPLAQAADVYFPLPNLPGNFNNFRATVTGLQRWLNLVTKLDHRFSASDELSFRLQTQRAPQDVPFGGSDLGTFGNKTQSNAVLAGLIWYHQFSLRWFNEARASVQRATARDWLDPGAPDFAAKATLPGYTFTGMAAFGYSSSAPGYSATTYMEFADCMTWIRSRHVFKWGGEFQPGQMNQVSTKNTRGTIAFQDKTWTSKAYADFLMGLMRSSSLTDSESPNYMRGSTFGLFVQDTYRVSEHLTLNFGLRYERPGVLTEKYGHWSSFLPDLATQVTARPAEADLPSARDLGLPEALRYPNNNGLTPRFGLGWRPLNSRALRVGASWGMFLSTPSLNSIRQDMAEAPPFLDIWKSTRTSSDPASLTLDNPFPPGGTEKRSFAGYDLHPALPYLHSWNFSVQDHLGKGRTLELQYAGSKGTHLARRYDLNQSIKDVSLITPSGSLPKPYPDYKKIDYYSFGSNSSYNALLVAFTRRFGSAWSARLNYAYAKSIDDQSTSVPAGGFAGAQDSRNLRLERARCDWDARHTFKLTFDAESPWKRNLWLRKWAFSGIGSVATGLPFTVQVQNPDTGKGEASRPDRLASGQPDSPGVNGWYDLAAFPPVPAGGYRNGTSGRNVLSGPGVLAMDLSLRRPFYLSESSRLEFRADAYNAVNHANLGLPATFVNSPNAGTIISAKAGRVVQLSGKFVF